MPGMDVACQLWERSVLMPQTQCSVPIGRLNIGSLRVRITEDDSLYYPHPPRFSVDPSDTFLASRINLRNPSHSKKLHLQVASQILCCLIIRYLEWRQQSCHDSQWSPIHSSLSRSCSPISNAGDIVHSHKKKKFLSGTKVDQEGGITTTFQLSWWPCPHETFYAPMRLFIPPLAYRTAVLLHYTQYYTTRHTTTILYCSVLLAVYQ